MKATDIPSRFPIPFAYEADSPYIRVVPLVPPGGGAASLQEGFPPDTFTPVVAGGIPPAGQDFNGLLYQISAWARWQAAGGPVPYNADFVAINGGYPANAVIAGSVPGLFWLSSADDNTTDPEGGSPENWTPLLGEVAPLNIGTGLTSSGGFLLLANSGVAPGTYRRPIVTVDQYGRVTDASNAGLPTVTRLTSGSGNFTPNANTTLMRVRILGGGGGGSGSGSDGTAGGDTSFGGWTAIGGAPASALDGGLGGRNGTNGTGTLVVRMAGNSGGAWRGGPIGGTPTIGGFGGNGFFGGGPGAVYPPTTAIAGAANSGSGGAGAPGAAGFNGRGGGGAGEYVEFYKAPTGSAIAYAVGAAGAGGSAGASNAGAPGGSGVIIIEET